MCPSLLLVDGATQTFRFSLPYEPGSHMHCLQSGFSLLYVVTKCDSEQKMMMMMILTSTTYIEYISDRN